MKKVYQTIVDKKHGNCMQAAIASLFEVELEEVPNFIEYGCCWFEEITKFFFYHNYDNARTINRNWGTEALKKIAKIDGGVNGYFYAVVKSQTFEDGEHAVIVDTDLNIVHDPNPNGKALLLKPDDVLEILVTCDLIIRSSLLSSNEELIASDGKLMLYVNNNK